MLLGGGIVNIRVAVCVKVLSSFCLNHITVFLGGRSRIAEIASGGNFVNLGDAFNLACIGNFCTSSTSHIGQTGNVVVVCEVFNDKAAVA